MHQLSRALSGAGLGLMITIDQDIHFICDVQKGMHSKGFDEAWLNDDEARVQHYHDWLNRYMEDG